MPDTHTSPASKIIAIAEAAKGGTTNLFMIGELDKIIKEAKAIDSKHRKTK